MSNKIIQRIKKLLALAESDNEHEAERAAEMARRLMMEHAVSQAQVDAAEAGPAPIQRNNYTIVGMKLVPGRLSEFDGAPRRTAHWKRDLVHVIARYLDIGSTWVATRPWVTFVGSAADAEVAAYLWEVAAQQIDYAAKVWRRGVGRYAGLSMTDFKRSAVDGLDEKLKSLKVAERSDPAQAGGHALMLRKKDAIDQWVKDNIRFSTRRASRGSYRSSSAGFQAGKKVKLHRGVAGSNNTTKAIGG